MPHHAAKIFQESFDALVKDLRDLHEGIVKEGHDPSHMTIEELTAHIKGATHDTPDNWPVFQKWSTEPEQADTGAKRHRSRTTAMLKAEVVRGKLSINFLCAAGFSISPKAAIVISTIQMLMEANPNIPLTFPRSTISPLECDRWLREVPRRHVAIGLDQFPWQLLILFIHAYGCKEMAVAKINERLRGTSRPFLKNSALQVLPVG